MALLLIAFGLVVYTAIRRALINQFDTSLASTARIMAAAVEQDANEIELEFEVSKMPEFQTAEKPAYYQLWRQDGSVAAKSPLLGADDLLRFEGSPGETAFRALRLKGDRPGRAVGLKFNPRTADGEEEASAKPDESPTLTLVVAKDAGDLLDHLRLLRWLLLIASGGTVVLSVIVAAVVVRQGLSPLNSLAAEIAAINENDLATRFGAQNMPAEIVPIKDRLNELLGRLEASFMRERRFTADVAHELRTPLAGLRSTLEVAVSRGRTPAEYQASLGDCLAIAKSMQAMVGNLLTLGRIEAKQVTFRPETVGLAELVEHSWRSFSAVASERNITFENRIEAKVTCEADRENLSMVFSNLLANAAEHTDEAGRIWTAAEQTTGSVEVTVANTGCKLTADQVKQVFDCFWRGDSARAGTGTHCGLGLSLVQRIVAAMGGSTSAEVQPGGIFCVRLVLPASNEPH
jgi:signal transduction histidine kinase